MPAPPPVPQAPSSPPGLDVIVTRHPATARWLMLLLQPQGRRLVHLYQLPADILERPRPSGDRPDWSAVRFFGNLPHELAAKVCAQGAEFWAVEFQTPQHLRGRELSAVELNRVAPRLVRYLVQSSVLGPRSGIGRSRHASASMPASNKALAS